DGQSDPEPSVGAIERPLALHEQIENMRQQLGSNAAAVVTHIDRDVRVVLLDTHFDFPAWVGVFHRVVQNVPDALHEARTVAAHVNRHERLRDDQPMRFLAHERLYRLRGLLDDLAELERLAAYR